MKLIIKQYLSSLKERGELDSMLPALLSQIGLNVFSRPQKGTRQDGVDVGAVGSLNGEPERVYLFSIKAGDLTRSNWDGEGPQSLRPSLNEILDSYIPHRLSEQHKNKDVVVCICIGGDVQEQVRSDVAGYYKQNKRSNLSFEEWNGDKLATLILSSFLREDLLPKNAHPQMRKALALLDEPEASYRHFASLINSFSTAKRLKPSQETMILRQINICLWILFSWARDADNLESAYLSGEFALLHAWEIAKKYASKKTKDAVTILDTFRSIVAVYLQICSQYIRKILPHTTVRHSLSVAVQGSSELDVNLKLFDVLGRFAIAGIWSYWSAQHVDDESRDEFLKGVETTSFVIKQFIWNNPTLLLPMKDNQVIDISIAVLLLMLNPDNRRELVGWLYEIINRADFAIQVQGRYPCILHNYSELLEHPVRNDDDYFRKVTSGSVLYPTIALWAALLEETNLYGRVQAIKEKHLGHCNFQLWYPDASSENAFYTDDTAHHGATLSHASVGRPVQDYLNEVFKECDQSPYFKELSAVKYGFWPLILIACRHYRLPVPPHMWRPQQETKEKEASDP